MKLVVGNWKMNKTRTEAAHFRDEFAKEIGAAPARVEISLATACPLFADASDPNGRWTISAQNCSAESSGAFTGEVSARMLASCGCRYVLVGHSERRKYFGEKEVLLAFKLARAREAGLLPILCVGETLRERRDGLMEDVLSRQIESLDRDPADSPLVVAYEPVWAIGTGQNAEPEQAQEAAALIASLLPARADLRVLYGGSVTPDNASQIAARSGIDGFLVGGASLDPTEFAAVCRACSQGSTA